MIKPPKFDDRPPEAPLTKEELDGCRSLCKHLRQITDALRDARTVGDLTAVIPMFDDLDKSL